MEKLNRMMMVAAAVCVFAASADAFDAANLQREIDAASAAGGGTVIVPKGTWETGPLALKSGAILHLEKGATLLGSTNVAAYKAAKLTALIHTEKAENVAIEGEGTIDGRGGLFGAGFRPHLVNFRDCRNVRVEGVTLRCGGSWTLNPLRCDGVTIRNVKIWSHVNHCNDGIDISSRNVLIEDCDVDADDDALVFKTPSPDVVVENVRVRNCRLASSCNAIKFGTESHGALRNVEIRDCTLAPTSAQGRFDWRRNTPGVTDYLVGLAGIAVECVDGEALEDVTISSIRMDGYQTPILVRLGRRNESRTGRSACLKNVLIENVKATGVARSRIACSITGVPGLRPEGITIRNVDLLFPGGGTAVDVFTPVPEVEKAYPENRMFHAMPLPAYAFFVRHADGVRFENVRTRLLAADARPAVVIDDAEVTVGKDCSFAPPSDGSSAVVRFAKADVKNRISAYWKSLDRGDAFLFRAEAAYGAKPPLVVFLGGTRERPPEVALGECRMRGWSLLAPFARDVKGVMDAIASVKGESGAVFLKGDGSFASLALELSAANPDAFAAVSAVSPAACPANLARAKGADLDIDLVVAARNANAKAGIEAFHALCDAKDSLPADVVEETLNTGRAPASFRFSGTDSDFPRGVRPLTLRRESGRVRLSVTATKEVSCVKPSFDRFARSLRARSLSPVRLILAGDSTMAHRTSESKAGSWGEALSRHLRDDVEIVNCAIGGRSTRTYADAWRTNVVPRIRPGDWVLIQFGHNDMSRSSDPKIDRQTDPDTEYANNLRRFVADVRLKGGNPLLVTSITLYLYNRDPKVWPVRNPLARWVDSMKRLAVESRTPIIDLNASTLAAVRDAGAANSAAWYMYSVNGKDWAHPTKAGAALFADLFVRGAREAGSPVVSLFRSSAGNVAVVTVDVHGKKVAASGAEVLEASFEHDGARQRVIRFRYEPAKPGCRLRLSTPGISPRNWFVLHDNVRLGKWLDEELEKGVDLGVLPAGVIEIGKRGGLAPSRRVSEEWRKLLVQVKSTLDGTMQPCWFWAPEKANTESVPLVVGLHTWSGDYTFTGSYAPSLQYAQKNGWAFVGPNFRGPNSTPEACGGEAAVQDIVDAVNYAKDRVKIDAKRVYIIGGSGGGHMTLLMAGRHPEIWAGCAAFCPITDVARWHRESLEDHPGRGKNYAQMLEKACGGTPAEKAEAYRPRSPLTWIDRAAAAGVPCYIVTGIHDGWKGSVPVGHSFRAYNALAAEKDRVPESVIAEIEATQTVPAAYGYKGPQDPFYGPKMRIHFRGTSQNVRFTLFEGGHGGNFAAGLDFLSRQVKGRPADFTLPASAQGSETKLAR